MRYDYDTDIEFYEAMEEWRDRQDYEADNADDYYEESRFERL